MSRWYRDPHGVIPPAHDASLVYGTAERCNFNDDDLRGTGILARWYHELATIVLAIRPPRKMKSATRISDIPEISLGDAICLRFEFALPDQRERQCQRR